MLRSLKLFSFALGKLGMRGDFTMNKSRVHITECYWFLLNSFYVSIGKWTHILTLTGDLVYKIEVFSLQVSKI